MKKLKVVLCLVLTLTMVSLVGCSVKQDYRDYPYNDGIIAAKMDTNVFKAEKIMVLDDCYLWSIAEKMDEASLFGSSIILEFLPNKAVKYEDAESLLQETFSDMVYKGEDAEFDTSSAKKQFGSVTANCTCVLNEKEYDMRLWSKKGHSMVAILELQNNDKTKHDTELKEVYNSLEFVGVNPGEEYVMSFDDPLDDEDVDIDSSVTDDVSEDIEE